MATGTGKTKTAQVCIADFMKNCDVPAVVFIICPQDTLAKQWLRDIQDSGIPADNYVICDSDSRGWNKEGENSLLYKLLDVNVERAGKKNILFVYSTFDTYHSEYFVNTVQQYKLKAKYLIIGDEVHGLGSSQRAKGFLEDYEYRLGLSATPDRWFDEHGTQVITDFFGSDRYYFTIEEALTRKNPLTGKTYLTPYEYIPRFSKIGRAIKENCEDDLVMQHLLLDLLEFNLTGRQWYKDEYTRLIQKYAEEREKSHED